jgi:hypothetical protein
MRGIIYRVFGVIERVNVQIDFDPFLLAVLARAHALASLPRRRSPRRPKAGAPKLNRKSRVFHSHVRDRALLGFVLAFRSRVGA